MRTARPTRSRIPTSSLGERWRIARAAHGRSFLHFLSHQCGSTPPAPIHLIDRIEAVLTVPHARPHARTSHSPVGEARPGPPAAPHRSPRQQTRTGVPPARREHQTVPLDGAAAVASTSGLAHVYTACQSRPKPSVTGAPASPSLSASSGFIVVWITGHRPMH